MKLHQQILRESPFYSPSTPFEPGKYLATRGFVAKYEVPGVSKHPSVIPIVLTDWIKKFSEIEITAIEDSDSRNLKRVTFQFNGKMYYALMPYEDDLFFKGTREEYARKFLNDLHDDGED